VKTISGENMTVRAQIDLARAALRGGDGAALRVLARRDGAPPVALLATLGRSGGDVVLPLREGRNFVGRGFAGSEPYADLPRHLVEQAQWFIDCSSPAAARVVDAASTNLSVWCRAGVVPGTRHDGFGFDGFAELPGARFIPHANELRAGPVGRAELDEIIVRHGLLLHEGDVLRSAYATFAFAWTAP
jgi:hypothetical protein